MKAATSLLLGYLFVHAASVQAGECDASLRQVEEFEVLEMRAMAWEMRKAVYGNSFRSFGESPKY